MGPERGRQVQIRPSFYCAQFLLNNEVARETLVRVVTKVLVLGVSIGLSAIALLGCQGVVQDPGEAVQDSSGPSRPPPDGTCGVTAQVPHTPLARLTAAEYQRTVSDLLGRNPELSFSLAADSEAAGFRVGTGVPALLAEQYVDAALEIAARVVAEDLDGLVPCASDADRACAESFLTDFGTRAFRRPITDEEKTEYLAAFDLGSELDFATGIESLVASVLASPKLLYRLELPVEAAEPGTTAAMDSFSLASRLSYFIWGSAPDQALLNAAASGELAGEGLEAQARRMLDDPKGVDAVREFARQWLKLDRLETIQRDTEFYTEFNDVYRSQLRSSMDAFIEDAFRGPESTITNLFTSDVIYADDELASALGLSNGNGNQFTAGADRRGLLTQPGFLAIHGLEVLTDPIHRGLFVRNQVLCQTLPEPPDNVDISIPDPEPNETTREFFTRLTSDVYCSGCHSLINPLGFAFEHFDAIGRWRADEDGRAIDASGELNGTDVDGPFSGAVELGERIAGSETAATCMALQWFRFGLGREETDYDSCSLAEIESNFAASGGDLRELMVAIVKSDAFRHVYVQPGADR